MISQKYLPYSFYRFHSKYGASSLKEIIAKYNCLQVIKPGDTVRFLNVKYLNEQGWAYQPTKNHICLSIGPLFQEIIFFDAISVNNEIKLSYGTHTLNGNFVARWSDALHRLFGDSSDLINRLLNDKLSIVKDIVDIKLINQLYESGYNYSFWTRLTDINYFVPIKIVKALSK